MASSYFNPLRRSPSAHISIIIDDDALRGTAFMIDTTDGTKAIPAQNKAMGFLFRDVTTLTDDEKLIRRTQAWGDAPPVAELELPDEPGGSCTLEKLEKFECEGPDFVLTTGTGAMTGSESPGDKISFMYGKIRQLQGSDTDQGWRVRDVLDPEDSDNDARFVIENIN